MGSDDEQGGKFPYAGSVAGAVAMGARHVNKNVNVSFFCFENAAFSTMQ